MLDCSLQLHRFFLLFQIEFMLPSSAQRPFVISSKDSSSTAHQNESTALTRAIYYISLEPFTLPSFHGYHQSFCGTLSQSTSYGVLWKTSHPEYSAELPHSATSAANQFLTIFIFLLLSCNYMVLTRRVSQYPNFLIDLSLMNTYIFLFYLICKLLEARHSTFSFLCSLAQRREV